MQKIKSKGKWKVILTKGVRKLGKKGDVVEVKHGYFRNYLANGLAVSYDEKILDEIKSTLKDTFDAKNEEIAGKQKEKLEEKFLCFGRQASGTDILFASVTFKDIVAEIKSRFSIDINYKKVHMNNSIKKIGIYEFFIDLSENITVKMYLSVGRSVENAEAMIKEYTKI
jgi:large subunit ribosomal protein L9